MNKINIFSTVAAVSGLMSVGVAFASYSAAQGSDELESLISKSHIGDSADFQKMANKYGIATKPVNAIKNNSINKKEITSKAKNLNKSQNTKKSATDLGHSEKKASDTDVQFGELYLRNVPQKSHLMFTKKLTLLPNEKNVYFIDGTRVYSQPEYKTAESNSFCMLNFKDSGSGRRATQGTYIGIKKVEEKNTSFYDNHSQKVVLIRTTKFSLDNPELKQLVCMGISKSKPLTVNNLSQITGNLINVKIQDYIDI